MGKGSDGGGGAGRPRLPANCYWRGPVIWARFQVSGQSYRESLRTGAPGVAAKRLALLKRRVEDEAVYGAAAPVTWPDAVVAWRADGVAGIRASTLKRYQVSLRMMQPFLDALDVQLVTLARLTDVVRTRRRQGTSNATIRRDLTAVSSVLANAKREGWIETNPARAFERDGIPEVRDPFELPDEASIAAVCAHARASGWARLADMIDFALEAGPREEEIAGLVRKAVDRPRRAMTLTKTKARRRRTRTVPLTPHALAVIDRQPEYLGSDYVFWRDDGMRHVHVASRFGALRKATAQKLAQQGRAFVPFAFHDLRHLFAVRYLRDRRGSIYDLQQIMGHASIKTTEQYLDFLTPEERRFAEGLVTPPVTAPAVSSRKSRITG